HSEERGAPEQAERERGRSRTVQSKARVSNHEATSAASSSTQKPLARHVVDLEPDAIGILEQHRVIAGRPLVLARRADDPGADRGEESVQFVDIGALAGAEAEVMQPDAVLVEGCTGVLRRRRADR